MSATLVLRVLQLMCEGHHTVLQNYLRTQPDNIRSINLVKVLERREREIDRDRTEKEEEEKVIE